MNAVKRHRIVVDDSALAARIGERLRQARLRAGLTQQQLAQGRYTKAYISALEKGHAKPSMAALNFISERLGLPASHFLADPRGRWDRLEADLLLASGRWVEAADAYLAILSGVTDRGLRAEVLCGRAEALCRLDRGDAAIAPAAEALEIFGTLGRRREAALATYWLAYAHYLAENRAEARSLLSGLLTDLRATEDSDPDLRLRVLMALSSVESTDDDHRSALAYLEEARVLATDLDDWRRGAFLSMLAASYSQLGDLEGAIRSGAESLALFRSAEAQRETAILENNLAVAYLRIGNVSRAREMAAHARIRHESEGDRRSLAHVAETEAQIALSEERYPDAIALAGEAIEHAEASGNPRAMTSALVTIARAEAGDGRPDDAIETYRRATELTRQVGPVHRLQHVLGEWAELLAAQGRHQEAYSLSREALQSVTVPLIDARPLGASKVSAAAGPDREPATASVLLDDVKPTPVAG